MSKLKPPVPPNLEWFFMSAAEGCEHTTFGFSERGCSMVRLDDECLQDGYHAPSPNQRRIIALVAAQGWDDEAQRRVSAAECSKYRVEGEKLYDVECEDNRRAWLKWGGISDYR